MIIFIIVFNYYDTNLETKDVMARSHWPTDTKRMHKGHSGRAKFRGWLHPFSSAPEMDKICENLRKQNGK